MATYPQIEKILQEQVDIFNRNESKSAKATVEVKPSAWGRGLGNSDGGRHCVYDVSIIRHLLSERVLRVWHIDGQSFFPESTTIYIYSGSGERREELAVSPEHLTARLSAIFESEEWDVERRQ